MHSRGCSRQAVDPWANDKSQEWFQRVRGIKFINPPRPPSSNLFNDDASLAGGEFSRRCLEINLREIIAIMAGISFGALVSLVIVMLCYLVF